MILKKYNVPLSYQLSQLRMRHLGDIICDNTVDIPATRKNAFRTDSHFIDCNNNCHGHRSCKKSSHSSLNVGAFVTNVPGETGQDTSMNNQFSNSIFCETEPCTTLASLHCEVKLILLSCSRLQVVGVQRVVRVLCHLRWWGAEAEQVQTHQCPQWRQALPGVQEWEQGFPKQAIVSTTTNCKPRVLF